MPTRLATKAKIKRASATARQQANQLDASALIELKSIYQIALAELRRIVAAYGGDGTSIKLEAMRDLLRQLALATKALQAQQQRSLATNMRRAAGLSIDVFTDVIGREKTLALLNSSVVASRSFVGADGLQLSDRLWRLNSNSSQIVGQAVQSAIIQSKSASDAARDFLQQGQPIPADIIKKQSQGSAGNINRVLGKNLMREPSAPYQQARQLFRTEINRAHGMAYQASVFELDDTAGTRFLLSPAHPKPDICDMHAKANLHGLGAGVYPRAKSPWPAHPNTLSYEEVVFRDEVSATDKAGKEKRQQWLLRQPRDIQTAVLGGQKKQQLFVAGRLRENQYATPWRILKKRFNLEN